MLFRNYCAGAVLGLLLIFALPASSRAAAEPPQYLLFQIMTGSPDPATSVYRRALSRQDLAAMARHIIEVARPQAGDPQRILGFAVGPITMDEGADGARSIIRDAFEVALHADLAVALHLDDYMFWREAPHRRSVGSRHPQ